LSTSHFYVSPGGANSNWGFLKEGGEDPSTARHPFLSLQLQQTTQQRFPKCPWRGSSHQPGVSSLASSHSLSNMPSDSRYIDFSPTTFRIESICTMELLLPFNEGVSIEIVVEKSREVASGFT
jgi:hypothetical protein